MIWFTAFDHTVKKLSLEPETANELAYFVSVQLLSNWYNSSNLDLF